MATKVLSIAARAAMFAEAYDALTRSRDLTARKAAAAMRPWAVKWLHEARPVQGGSGWKAWEPAAKKFVADEAMKGDALEFRRKLIKGAEYAETVLNADSPYYTAGVPSQAAQALIRGARNLLKAVRVGKVPGSPLTRSAAKGAAAAAAGAAAATAGRAAGERALEPGSILDPSTWGTPAKVLGAAAAAWAIWRLAKASSKKQGATG